jgi:hypothetical protein
VGTRTTITLDEDVRAKLEAEMRKTGKSFKETVNETLRSGLFARQKKAAKPKLFKIKAKDLGLKPGYSFDKPWDLIEEIEGPDYK